MKTTLIVPDDKYRRLKDIAYKRRTSLAKIINDALDDTYFSDRGGFNALKGLCSSDRVSAKDLEDVKIKSPKLP